MLAVRGKHITATPYPNHAPAPYTAPIHIDRCTSKRQGRKSQISGHDSGGTEVEQVMNPLPSLASDLPTAAIPPPPQEGPVW